MTLGEGDFVTFTCDPLVRCCRWLSTLGIAIAISSTFARPTLAAPPVPEWNNFYYDAENSDYNPLEHKLSEFNVHQLRFKWSAAVPGGITGMAIDRGVLYAEGDGAQGNNDAVLYAFNATTGAPLWNVTLGDDGFFIPSGSPIAAHHGLVFAGCNPAPQYGGICAFRYFGGHLMWGDFTGCLGGPPCSLISGPLFGRGTVFESYGIQFGGGNGFAALDPATGTVLWADGFGNNGLGSNLPILAAGLVDFGCNTDNGTFTGVCAVAQATGQPVWQQQTGTTSDALSSGGGLVFVNFVTAGPGPEELYALNAATGAVKWTFGYNAGSPGSLKPAAYANGVVYFKTVDGAVFALNAWTGNVLWQGVSGCAAVSAPVVANGVVYLNCQGRNGPGTLAISARTGAPLWKRPNNGSALYAQPIVWNSMVYSTFSVCNGGDDLCVYGLP